MPSTRRAVLTTSSAALLALAGCTGRDPATDSPSTSPSDTSVPSPSPGEGDRPTQTPRDPTPLSVSGSWPQPGYGPGHAGVTTATGVPDDAEPYWQLRRVRSGPPLLADGRLYHFGLTGEGADGTPTRTATMETGTGRSPGGALTLFCRDASDGRRSWTRRLPGRTRSGTIDDGRVLVGGEGFVAAYRGDDGAEIWRRDLGDRHASVTTAVDGTAFVSTQFVREGDRKPDVRAYAVGDGSRRWKRGSPKQGAGLAADGDAVVALSTRFGEGSVLTARSVDDGSERWSVEIDDDGMPRAPLVVGRTVYVSSDDGLLALNADDGSRRWREAATAGIAPTGDAVYAVQDGRLSALDPDDAGARWSVAADGDREYRGVPAVGGQAVYLEKGGFPADVVALSRSDGSERWAHRLPETTVEGDMVTSGLAGQPTVAEGAVYAYAQDGLYAFGPTES